MATERPFVGQSSCLSQSSAWQRPSDFSSWRKYHVVLVGIVFTFNSTMGSSLPSGMQAQISQHYNVQSRNLLVLMTSLYMCGFVIGPLVFGPLSEYYGRKPVLLVTYIGYMGFTAGCALSPSYISLLVFRALSGVCAAAPNAITSGLYADIYPIADQRGMAMAIFTFMTMLGPQIGPILSGFVSLANWYWPFWIALIVSLVELPLLITLPETYGPVLSRQTASGAANRLPTLFSDQGRRKDGLEILIRPFVMGSSEPILFFSSLYLALVYAVLYLFFQSYPIIFQDFYGLPQGTSELAFVPLIIGSGIGLAICLAYDQYHRRAVRRGKSWASREEYRRLPLAIIGAPLITVALFWLAWLSKKQIDPIIPMISGIWFACGFLLVFVAILNYITDAYRESSASAHAAASAMRSIAAVCLPLATNSMYSNLGIQWATSLLGFIAASMAIIPFIFVKYGAELRSRSPLCRLTEGV